MKCVKCNKKIDDTDIYCGYCGIHQEKFKKYLTKVEKKIHKDRDKEYNKNVKTAQDKLQQLQKDRENEVQRIIDERWESIGNNFSFNMTEGKVLINGTEYLFSDIKGAEIVKQDSTRIVTNTTETSKGKSRKHASLGGAVAGGLILGPVGAVVGGSALGKTTSKGTTNVITNSNAIPTCYHIGINVDLNGFTTEIVLLSNTVDQSSNVYNNTINDAQLIIDKLRILSKTPVPKKFLKPEEEKTVLDIEKEIELAAKELKIVSDNKPTYEIPESYLK